MFPRLLALGVALLAPVAALAGGKFAAPTTPTATSTEIGSGAGVLQIFGSLALVIATILLVGWIARRLRQTPRSAQAAMRVVDEITVGNKERVVLLEVDGTRLVLGVGDGRVAILHRTAAVPTVGAVTPGASEPSGNLPVPMGSERFVDLLRRSLGK